MIQVWLGLNELIKVLKIRSKFSVKDGYIIASASFRAMLWTAVMCDGGLRSEGNKKTGYQPVRAGQ
jgi:hypothetical protein